MKNLQFEDGKMIPASKYFSSGESASVELTDDEKKMAEEIRASDLCWLAAGIISDLYLNELKLPGCLVFVFNHRTSGRASSVMSQPSRTQQTSSSLEPPPWMWSGERSFAHNIF